MHKYLIILAVACCLCTGCASTATPEPSTLSQWSSLQRPKL